MKKTIKGQFEKLMAEVAAATDVKFTDFARSMNDIMTKPDWSTIKPLPKKSFLKGIICLFIRHKWILGWWCRRCGKQKRIRLQTFKRNFMISKESIEHLRKINKRMIDKNKLNHELDTWNYFCLFNKKPKSDTPLIDTGELRRGLK